MDLNATLAEGPSSTSSRWLDHPIQWIEHAAGILVIVELIVLGAAVIFRYVLDMPLTWSDELAELVIVWQAMLGAVIAFHRRQHLGLSSILGRLESTKTQQNLEMFSSLIVCIVCLPLAYFSLMHVIGDADLMSPSLGISPSWTSGALTVGLTLIGLLSLWRLASSTTDIKTLVCAVALVVVLVAAYFFGRGAFVNLGNWNLLIFFIGVGGTSMVLGVPIAFAFGLAAMAYVGLATFAPMSIVVTRMETGMAHVLYLAVPLFVVLGSLITSTGMARRLVEFLASLLGHVKAGLQYVLIGAMVLVSGISGAKAADIAAIAPVLLPEMKKRGEDEGELVSLLAASSAMSETIPPSLLLIMIGALTGVSIGALFTAGWVPSLLLALMLCALARWRSRGSDTSHNKKFDWRLCVKTGIAAIPVLVLPFLIRIVVVEGIATATEVATVGIAYILIASLIIQRTLNLRAVYHAMKEAAVLTGTIFIILAMANAMGWAFIQSGFGNTIQAFANALPGGAATFMLVSVVIFFVLGSVLEGVPALVILGPLLFPVAKNLGISDVQYAIVAVLSCGLGLFTPPFGVGFYMTCAISQVSPATAMKAIAPYLFVILIGVVIVALVPWFSTGFL
ncbi:TRAP transporter large permease subunit [Rhizobium sp. BK060]|uniref:TRAP transporter large permease n=1 Tax=Rhizobium sp. BK060 TaxID=2587096 RepID=UPI0016212C8E|nr:TRAP transporter large permease subunit [Rhizobium sp. BK060]MBB3396166.1 tripartite ATP-independent transporter DctM subunit [Rhizobium sp. BK060]